MKTDNIPAELREPAKWLQYYLVPDPKKPNKKATKHPEIKFRTPQEKQENFRSLDYLIENRKFSKNGGGYQRYVDPKENFTYIDIDTDKETHALPSWAQTVVDDLNTYTEWSTGKGLRLVARGRLPRDFKVEGNKLEIYCGHIPNKLMAVTGDVVDLQTAIEDRQPQLEALLKRAESGEFGPGKAEPQRLVESTEPQAGAFPLTDLGNAERVAHRYGGKFVHTAATGWMVYEQGTWKRDDTRNIVRAMHDTIRLIETEDPGNSYFLSWAKKSESSGKISAALEQASALQIFARNYANFDQRSDLFNVANGTINLKTCEFLPHDPSCLLTKQSPITYDPEAKCPRWEQFVLDIMNGKEHMREYLRRCCGYTLTADTSGQCFFLPWGVGGSGKSTMLGVQRGIMGNYCRVADPELFMLKRGDEGQPFALAGLEGSRLLLAIETEEGKRIATSRLKRMTGQDPIVACYKFHDQYEFIPQWKIWLATNDAPVSRADDSAFWDRAKPIPFEVKFRGTEREIKDFADILLHEEGSGILNWMLAGLKQYQEIGLAHPKDVAKKADEWRDRDDWLARFIEDIGFVKAPGKFVPKADLWSEFTSWAEKTKQATRINDKVFTQAMRQKGFDDDKPIKLNGKTTRVWHNVCSDSSLLQDSGETF